jgi:hypothetical protein
MQRLQSNIGGAVPSDCAQVPELQVIQHPPDMKKMVIWFLCVSAFFKKRNGSSWRVPLSSRTATGTPTLGASAEANLTRDYLCCLGASASLLLQLCGYSGSMLYFPSLQDCTA